MEQSAGFFACREVIKYGGIADFVSESECENRIDAIVSQIADSNLFEKPTVIKKLWKQNYTADDFGIYIGQVFKAKDNYNFERYGYKIANNIAPFFNFGAQTEVGARIAIPVTK